MSWVALIRLEKGLFLAHNDPPGPSATDRAKGWQPYKWTRALDEAEKFASREAAEAWGSRYLPHDRWEVIAFPVAKATHHA